ncbi:XRE family transcriptional regulator [Oerskovia turbata]|uniref:XRE family transcriptional regulator n=2 Tax=Oerskovia turbata TaxID=1713 RepID=A0A4Q1L128_9CELL|nr:XRE family transcriptional regulator [Oerskovia turbata]RXR35810.1 XRE family transcriptional regulator [Oerskovia turbata]TGJ96615.1 XRE family transcriptional regulator [Actinotalea fermentans ATCC 43279 = JCM 9966 = DSM 3133]
MCTWLTLSELTDTVGEVPRERPLESQLAMALAMQLRRRRETVGLTQERAAERAGLSRNHYQLLEAGLSDRAKKTPSNPRLSTLVDIAIALDSTVPDLLTDVVPGRSGLPEVEYDGRH